jgi:xylulokinase
MQIAADILGHLIEPLEGHLGSCLGAAYVAGVAVGGFTGWDEIARYVPWSRPILRAPIATPAATRL